MADAPYSNRELDLKHEIIIQKLDSIDAKVTFTNGKVRKLIIAVATLFGLIIGIEIPTVGSFFTSLL